MLQKNPKPGYRKFIIKGAKILFVAEAFLFFSSYGIWYRMNTNRDFRLYMHNNFPWILEGYYQIGEQFNSENRIRDFDLAVWTGENKLSKSVK